MSVPFYDIKPPETLDGWIEVERIYCLDWDEFNRDLFDRLQVIFRALPQARKPDADGCFWWYSDREDIESGYLTAGVEPPGLQVFGTLPLATWQEWDRAFQAAIKGLPFRTSEKSAGYC